MRRVKLLPVTIILRGGALCFSIDDALRGLSNRASFIRPYSQELATMLASVWESDLIE